jgi:hypothetical protein
MDTLIEIIGAYSESNIESQLPARFFDDLQYYVLK